MRTNETPYISKTFNGIVGRSAAEIKATELRREWDRVVVFPTRNSGVFRIIASRGNILVRH